MSTKFVVEDAGELDMLQRALIEAKFPRVPDDPLVAASPIVAALAARLATLLADHSEWWEKWHRLSPEHAAWIPALNQALGYQRELRSMPLSAKQELIRNILAPYKNDPEAVAAFLAIVEETLRTRAWYSMWRRKGAPFDDTLAFMTESEEEVFTVWNPSKVALAVGTHTDVATFLSRGRYRYFGTFVAETGDFERFVDDD